MSKKKEVYSFNDDEQSVKQQWLQLSQFEHNRPQNRQQSATSNSQLNMRSLGALKSAKQGELSIKMTEPSKNKTNERDSQRSKVKSSTAKYRQKKKQELKNLQQSVKNLDIQLRAADEALRNLKDKIVLKLESNVRLNNQVNHENNQIYLELSNIIREQNTDIDLDKINLLIDTLKTRIGASGHQRQAKLNYHFKTIVNTLFPALYRYLLFTAEKNLDIFYVQDPSSNEANNPQQKPSRKYWQWTVQIMNKLNLSNEQIEKFVSFKEILTNLLMKTKSDIRRLNNVREVLKQKQLEIQKIEQSIRIQITPIDSAKIILFCEKYKFKIELFFEKSYQEWKFMDYEQQREGRKRVKLDLSEDQLIKVEDDMFL